MSQKVDKTQLVPPDGENLQDPPPQYQAGEYAASSNTQPAQPAAVYGYDQPADGYSKPAESYGYDQPADGYTRPPVTQQPAPHQQTTVVMNPSSPTVVVQQPAERPPDYIWLSCLVYWCCNCIVGGIAFAFSVASQSAADEGRMGEARSHSRAALGTSIFGMFFGIVSIAMIVLYWQGKFGSSDADSHYDHEYGYG